MNTLTNRGALAPLWLTVSLLHCNYLHAATWTWDGSGSDFGNANWSNKDNWNPNTIAANDGTADLVFSGIYELSNVMTSSWAVKSLEFSTSAGNFVIGGSNTLTINAGGLTNNDAGTQTVNVNTVLGTSQTWKSTAGNLVIGTAGVNRTLNNNGHTLTLDGAGTILFNSQLSGSGGLIKNGTGTATLSYGSNTIYSSYTGTTTVNNGTLIADLGSDTGSPTVPLIGTITVGGGVTAATFETRWVDQIGNSTAVNVLANGTLRVTAVPYNGTFPSSGNLAETIGSLNVSGGSLIETVSGTTTTTATLVLAGNITRDSLGTTTSTVSGNLSLGGATRTIAVGNSSAATDLTISAVISNGGIQKSGAGTLLLSGTNTYTGTTALTAGTTVINGNQSAATGALTVSSGATLSGTGTIGGATTISGTHAPGAGSNGVGNQTFNNGLTYASGSIFAWDLTQNSTTSGYDKVAGNGTLSVNSNAIFQIVLGSGIDLGSNFWTSDQTWNDVFTGLTGGNFSNAILQVALPSGEILVSNGAPLSLFGHGQFSVSGTSVNWSANPEPSSAVVGVLLAAGLLRRKRA